MAMLTWGELSRDFRNYLTTTGRSEGTARTYISNLSLFWHWCIHHELLPHDADQHTVREWLAGRRQDVSAARAHNDLAALRLFYAYVRELRWRDDDPTANISIKRPKALPTEPLSTGEMNELLAVCKDERDRLLVLMLSYTGMRISELASLTAEDIDWQKGIIRIMGKGEKERRLQPHPDVLNRLHAFVGMFAAGPVWLSKKQHQQLSAHQIRKILYELAERARIDHVHPHRFRSLFATEYIEQFADIQALQGVMGHTSIETTARYSQYTRERRGLRQMQQFTL